jgi:hypothetical protein
MSEYSIGDRVVVAEKLQQRDWQHHRRPNARGSVERIERYPGAPERYAVAHDGLLGNLRLGLYLASELTPLGEAPLNGQHAIDNQAIEAQLYCPRCRGDMGAQVNASIVRLTCRSCGWLGAGLLSEADAPTTVQEQLGELKERHAGLREAMASEIHGLMCRIAKLEPGPDPEEVICRAAMGRLNAEAAIEAARPWCELRTRDDVLAGMKGENRYRLESALSVSAGTRRAMVAALDAIPDLVAAAQAAAVRPSELQALRALRRAATEWQIGAAGGRRGAEENAVHQALQMLDEVDGDGDGDGDGFDEIDRLQQRLAEAKDELAAIVHKLRMIVPWDARGQAAELLLDAIERPAHFALRLLDAHTDKQLRSVALGLRALATGAGEGSTQIAVAEVLEQLPLPKGRP